MGCGSSTSAGDVAPGKGKAQKTNASVVGMGLAVAAGGMNIETQDMETSVGLETELDTDFAADYSHNQLQ